MKQAGSLTNAKKPEELKQMSHLEEINNVIFDYLKQEKIKSALLINGKWGSGKTYYLKNSVIPLIKTRGSGQELDEIYLSLYGIKSVDDLKFHLYVEAIQRGKLPKIVKSSGFKSLLPLLSIKNKNLNVIIGSLSPSLLFKDNKNYLLIFDDLERIDKNLGIEAVLGWINNFIEHYGIKTILVGDESKFTNSELYFNIKEKLVGTTVTFEPPGNVLHQINSQLLEKNKFDKLIQSQVKLIHQLYNIGAEQNLRSYEFSVNKLKYILKALDSEIDDLTEDLLRKIVIYTLAVSFEYKKGVVIESNISELEIDYFDRVLGIDERINWANDRDGNEEKPKIYEIIKNYFSKFGYSVTVFEEINSLIVHGRFNPSNFRKNILQKLGKGSDESENIYNKLYNFRSLKDGEELNQSVIKAIELCRNGKYSLTDSLFIADTIFFLSHNNVFDGEIDDLYNQFEEMIRNKSDDYQPIQHFGHNIEDTNRDYGDQFKDLYELCKDINDKNMQRAEKEKHEELFNLFTHDPNGFLDEVWNPKKKLRNELFLDSWSAVETAGVIFGISSNHVQSYEHFIKSRYQDRPDFIKEELEFLTHLVQEIESLIQQRADNFDKLKLFSIRELKESVDKIITLEKP